MFSGIIELDYSLEDENIFQFDENRFLIFGHLTAPKYFEISHTMECNNIYVHVLKQSHGVQFF